MNDFILYIQDTLLKILAKMLHLNQNFRDLVTVQNPAISIRFQESHAYNEADLTLTHIRFLPHTYFPVSFNIPVNNMKL